MVKEGGWAVDVELSKYLTNYTQTIATCSDRTSRLYVSLAMTGTAEMPTHVVRNYDFTATSSALSLALSLSLSLSASTGSADWLLKLDWKARRQVRRKQWQTV